MPINHLHGAVFLNFNWMVKNFPTFYQTQGFITMFTQACNWTLILSNLNSLHALTFCFFKIPSSIA
jgi:hypothetical protein